MRYVCPAVASLLAMLLFAPVSLVLGQVTSSDLSIDTNYTFVGQARYTRNQWYVTYRAELKNSGSALPSVVARVKSVSPNVVIVPEQDTVHFGPVPANGTISSADTFTILVDRTVAFSWSNVQWTIESPVANAGSNQTVKIGASVFLNGGGSTDPDGNAGLSYSWTLSPVPAGSKATLSNRTSVTPSFIADTAGQYGLNLTVNNGSDTDSNSTTVSTTSSVPVANAGPNQSVALHSTVTLDGSGSYDVDGNPLTYLWTLISVPQNSYATVGSAYASVQPTFTADVAGTYIAQLVVSDQNGTSVPATVTISTGNTPPVANAGPDQVVVAGSTVQLNGAHSTDVDGNSLSYKWSLLSVPSQSKATLNDPAAIDPTFTADVNGTYVAQLVVNDGTVDSTPSTVEISTNTILRPVANAGPDQAVNVNSNVTLAGSGSDPQKLPLSYDWSLISKPTGSVATIQDPSTPKPSFFVDFPGIYVAQLITNNGHQNSVPSTVVVTTGAAAPVALPGPDQNVAAGTMVTLDGTGSYDPDHKPLTYSWSMLHVPVGSNATLSAATSDSPSFIADLVGMYVAQLIVSNGTRSSDPVTVTINASEMKVTLTPSPLSVFLNAPGTVTVNVVPAAGPNGLVVNFSGFDPTIISLPSTVTIPANVSSVNVTVTPRASGFTNILASADGYLSGSATVNVGTASISVSLAGGVGVGHTVGGTVMLSAPAPSTGTNVTVSSNLTGIATVSPAIVAIHSGSTTGSFTVTGVNQGSAIITAGSTGYSSGTANILVSILGAIGLSQNIAIAPGHSAPITVTLSSPAPSGGETITLTSGDTTKVTVTSPVVIPAGATTPAVQPQVTGIALGSATITATGPGYTSGSQSVKVSATLSFSPQSTNIGVGGTQNITLNLSSASGSPIVVNLASSNTSVATVPSSVTIGANTTSVSVPVTGKNSGLATITASTTTANVANGTASINVASFGGITAAPTVSLGLGQSVVFPISLSSAAPQGGVTVTLSSSDSTKVAISPNSVLIAAGQTQPASQPQITGTGIGSATIAASAPGYVASSTAASVTASLRLSPQGVSITGTGSQTLTVTLSGTAPSGGVAVNLNASPTGIISVSSPITIQGGSTFATFTVTGVAPGATTLTASAAQAGITNATDSITVTSPQAISIPANVSVTPGQKLAFAVTLPAVAPQGGVTVSLTSSDTSKVTISPATVAIAAGQTQPATQPQITGVNFGSSTITASASGYASGNQTVKVAAALSFSSSPVTITGPATQNLTLNLSAPAPAPLTVNLAANTTGIVTIPSSVTIAQNATSTTVPVTGASIGSTTITASTSTPNVSSANVTVNVQSGGSIALPSNVSVGLGQSAPFQVTLSGPAPSGGLTVSLASSNSGMVSISPASVTIPAGATQPSTAPQVTGVAPGSATITASAHVYTSANQNVAVSASIALTPQSPSITVNSSQNLTLTLSGPAPSGGLTFNVSSNKTSVATVSSGTVTIPGGSTSVNVGVNGVATGSAVITASAPNLTSATDTVSVTPAVGIVVPQTLTVGPGQSVTFPVTLVSPPTSNVTVTLTLSNSSASLNFTSVSFNAGSTTPTRQPLLTGNSSGPVTISATAPGLGTATSAVTVGTSDTLTPNPLTISTTQIGTLTINLSSPAASMITFTLGSSNTSVATVPGSVRLGAGQQSVSFAVTPVGLGTTTITASASGFSPVTSQLTVQQAPPLSLSATNTSLQLGGITTLKVSLPSVSQTGSVTVTLTSSNGNVTISPTSVLIPQGSTSTTAQLTGMNVGSANISASAPGYSAPTPVTIQVGATISWSKPTVTIVGNGQQGSLSLTLSGFVPTGSNGVPITLSSSNTAVATVPSTVTFAANSGTNPTIQIPVTSVSPGNATIHASGTNITDVDATVTVVAPLSIGTTSLPNGSAGSSYNTTIQATGGITPYTFAATGLPANLTINSTTGQITGTPQAQGNNTVNVTVTDSNSPTQATVQRSFSLFIAQAAPASITATSGTPQTALTGAAFTLPLVATVKDANGNPLSGVSVTFTAPSSGASGTFSGNSLTNVVSTNASGQATSSTFTANSISGGAYTVTATVSGVGTAAAFSLTNSARPPSSITPTSGTPQTAKVHTAFAALVATVKDSNGNPVNGATVTFTAPTSGASGTFANGSNIATAATNSSGVATSPAFTANATAGGPYTVTAIVTGVSTPANFSLTNSPGPAAAISATGGTPQSIGVKTAFASPLSATVKDSSGNTISGIAVTFTAPSSGASGTFSNGSNTITVTTNSSGVAISGTFTANAVANSYNVTATVSGVSTPATFALTNLSGAAGSIVASGGTPQSVVVNKAFALPLSVTVKDSNNNPVSGATVTFNAPSSGASGKFANGSTTTTATTNGSGVASVSFTANTVTGSYIVTASTTGVTGSASFSLTNTAGPASSMSITSGSGQTAKINTAFGLPFVVTVKDAFGNAVSGAAVTFTAPSSAATGTFPGSSKTNVVNTNTSGIATSATFTANNTVGTYSVQASVPGVSNSVAFSVSNVNGTAASIAVTSGTPQSAAVTKAFSQPLVVVVKDSGGNPIGGASVTFTAPSSGASGTFANGSNSITVNTDTSGSATSGTFTANTQAGSYSVSASTSGVVTTASFALTNTVGPIASIAVVSGSSQSAKINTAFTNPLKAVVKDASGNPISGTTVTFAAPSTGPSGSFAGNVKTAVTDNTGTATSATFTANSNVGTYSVTATAGSASTTFSLTNTPGPVATLSVAGGSGQSATINNAFTDPLKVVAKDAQGNLVPGATISFSAPASGASGTWTGGGANTTAVTDGTGTATSPTFTANSKAGSYSVTASVGGVSTTFSLTNNAGAAAAIAATAGSNQSAAIGTAFAVQLQATVTDSSGNPVNNVQVTFSAPTSGASGTFSGNAVVTTNASGVATAPAFTANNTAGGYAVTAKVNSSISTSFNLTNRAGNPQNVLVFSGSGQSAGTNTAFTSALQAKVTDVGNNALRGISVTFTAPSAPNAGGTFGGSSNTATVTTDSNGIATAPTFTANGTQGAYNVVASVQNVSSTASFHLTNTQVACTGCGTISVSNATVGQNLETSIIVTLNPPAPASGLYLSYASSDANKLLVGGSATVAGSGSVVPSRQSNPNIPAGTTTFSIEVQALASSGTATVSISADNYNTGTSTITFAPAGFVIAGPNGVGGSFNAFEGSSTTLTVYSGPIDSNGALSQDQAIRGGFSVNVPITSSNSAVGAASPASVTLASNPTSGANSSATTSFNAATTTGSTDLSVDTPSGFSSPSSGTSVTATVQQAGIVAFTATVGQGLEQQENISLSGPAPSAVPITITSSNQSVLFACNPGESSTACTTPNGGGPAQSVTVTVGKGFTLSPIFLVEASGSTGSVGYTASAPGFNSVNGSVKMARAGLGIQSPAGLGASSFSANPQAGSATLTIYTGYLDGSGNFVSAQPLANGSLTVTAQSSNTSVATVGSPITISAGTDNASTGLTPTSSSVTGSTTVTVTAPNFTSASVTATYTTQQPALLMTGDPIVANGLELPYTLSLPAKAGSNGQQVTIQSSSSSLLLSATAGGAGASLLNLTVPANTSGITFYVQGAANAGNGNITASATGYSSNTQSLTLAPAGIVIIPSISGTANTAGSAQIFFVYLDSTNTPQFDNSFTVANQAVTLGVSSANPSVASVPSSITMNPGNGAGVVPVAFGNAGSTSISITQPAGFGQPNAYTSSSVTVNNQ